MRRRTGVYMDQILGNITQTTEQITNIYNQMTGTFIGVLGICLALLMLAFYSYRILRIELSASAAIGCGVLGYTFLAPFIFENIQGLPEWIDFAAILGLACAILGFVLAYAIHKLAIFIVGAASGFIAGFYVALWAAMKWSEVAFLQSQIFLWITCGVLALACGIIFVYLFKPLYIIVTAVGGSVAAAFLLGLSIFGENLFSTYFLIGTLSVGAIVGIVASVVQFKKASEA